MTEHTFAAWAVHKAPGVPRHHLHLPYCSELMAWAGSMQGMGRHSYRDISIKAHEALQALSTILGEKPYLSGDSPAEADASLFAWTDRVSMHMYLVQHINSATIMSAGVCLIVSNSLTSQYACQAALPPKVSSVYSMQVIHHGSNMHMVDQVCLQACRHS